MMGKLWGSGPSDNNDQESATSTSHFDRNGYRREPIDDDTTRRSEGRMEREPDEQTSLLDNRHHLEPDDPAVTPYNLLSVRSLRLVSKLFLVGAFLWWLTLFVNNFVTLPGLYTRGGGWFALAYSTFTIGILLVLLLFYGTPSKVERVILLAIFFFLAVNTILMTGAYPIRNQEAWIGIASVIFALFITAWAIICDLVVEYGKREEEERLTGRVETRYSGVEWFSVFSGTILFTIFLVISILFTINLSIRARDATLPPPGKLYQVADMKYHVHVNCVGSKTNSSGDKLTTVFIEGGEDPVEGGLENWVKEAYSNKMIPRYCYWDRPGMAWSENGPSPLSAGRAVDALSAALVQADETGPWIVVSHGVGGIYSRIFASRHVADIRGLVLIDALPDSLLHRLGSPWRGFSLWIRGIIYPLGIDRLVSTILMGHNRQDRIFGRDAYQDGGHIKAKLQESIAARTFTKNEVDAARAILPRDTPIVVVSSGKAMKKKREWSDGQRELTRLSDKVLAWDVVNGAGHNVWENTEGREILEKRLGQLMNYS